MTTLESTESTDFLASFGNLTAATVEKWVAAALARAAALREHDRWLYTSDPARLPAAERLHAAWRAWADEAELILNRAYELRAAGTPIAGSDDLAEAVGSTLCTLQMPPAVILQRHEQVRRGEVYTLEEVRRELRLHRNR